MKKIISYIAQGQGIGLKYLALLAFILGILGGVGTKVIATDGIPLAQQVADQLLPIKVVNGQIVEPQETYKVVHLRLGGDENAYPIPIVLDTTSDMLDINLLDQGAYITRSYLYMINEHEARTYKLDGDFELVQKDYTPEFTSFINWTALLVGTFVFAGLFVFYFLTALVFSFVAGLIGASKKIALDFNTKMRLSSVALITCVLLFWVLRLVGDVNVNMWLAVIVVVALQIYFIRCLKEQPTTSSNEIKSTETAQTKEEVSVSVTEKMPAKKGRKPTQKKESVKAKATTAKSTKAPKKEPSKTKAKEEVVDEPKPQKKRGRKPKA